MKRNLVVLAAIAVALSIPSLARANDALARADAAGDASTEPAKLRFDPQFVLEQVARRMGVALRPEVPVPAVLVESATPLQRFGDAVEAQWGFRPHAFGNAYSLARNEIYLIDDPMYYARLGRTLDESLAHELAHYLQVKYLRADLVSPLWEQDAIAVQAWFAETSTYLKHSELDR